jgi:hypothetical protein
MWHYLFSDELKINTNIFILFYFIYTLIVSFLNDFRMVLATKLKITIILF